MSEIKNEGAEWSIAYAVAIKRLDSQFMLCLLSLAKLPDLRHMHGDLVDHLRAICALLSKRPMVGFLISRRLKIPVDKTFALLNVLLSKGYIHTVGTTIADVNTEAVDAVNASHDQLSNNLTAISLTNNATALKLTPLKKSNEEQKIKNLQLVNGKKIESEVEKTAESSGDVLNQLWRVLNTDIVLSKAARSKQDPKSSNEKEAGEVLSQLWQILNSDIGAHPEKNTKSKASVVVSVQNKIEKNVLRDVNGHIIEQDEVTIEAYDATNSKAVMTQLWEVLNADIAFKRQSGSDNKEKPTTEKSKEITDVMSQLWRVLNTEIATKRQENVKNGSDSVSDTTIEANDKLKKFWRILDAEIKLKKQPVTHAMAGPLAGTDSKKVVETSVEAVSRLSQFWQVLNADITLDLPEIQNHG